jgi:hypothetical protein
MREECYSGVQTFKLAIKFIQPSTGAVAGFSIFLLMPKAKLIATNS